MIDFLLDFWGIAVAAIGFVVWLIRLEARSVSNTREIKRLWAVREEDTRRAEKEHTETNKKLDQLHDDIHEIGRTLTADIKHILERMPNDKA